ncbi:uncharacterized protein LOC117787061 [Drosophila innubila]|uniref:uncharacterized protein LOC117787061 n=1 Tax=Drosophila innubila TaxID=198719 RepID=UPI00148C3810|nr:uncharacterized protein LOC117787061 [Drosophila innubila]
MNTEDYKEDIEEQEEPMVKDFIEQNWKKSLTSCYGICSAELNFNLDSDAPIRHIKQPSYLISPLVIPKLRSRRKRLIKKPKCQESFKEVQTQKVEQSEKLPECSLKPILNAKRSTDLEGIPTSEEIWQSYEKWKACGEADWPICCQEHIVNQEQIDQPPKTVTPRSIEISDEEQLQQAVSWLTNSLNESQCSKKSEQEMPFDSMSFLEMDGLELGLDEERDMWDSLKSKGLHTPQSDIKEYDLLLSMARSEESRRALHEMVKSKFIEQFEAKKKCKCVPKSSLVKESVQSTLPKKQDTVKETTAISQSTKESISKAEKVPDLSPIVVKNKERDITSITELPKKLQLEKIEQQPLDKKKDQPFILNVQVFPPRPSFAKAKSLPATAQEQPQNIINTSTIKPIDFETEISRAKQSLPKITGPKQTQHLSADKIAGLNTISQISQSNRRLPQDINKWEGSFRQRWKGFENIIDQNMTEFSDPQGKRLRSKRIHESGITNVEHLKRILLMPELLSPVEQGLRKIGILRSNKRKVERESLQIDVAMVRTYSTMKTNHNLNLSQLALKLGYVEYNSIAQVLKKIYEKDQVAWIWDNGSILISNASSKTILTETEENLMAKILEVTGTPSSSKHNRLQSHMISLAQFPWQICIEKFCEINALRAELFTGSCKFIYYVNKSIPGVAAKVFETGMVHVLSMTPAGTDQMLENLYLLTSKHRKSNITTLQPPSETNSI